MSCPLLAFLKMCSKGWTFRPTAWTPYIVHRLHRPCFLLPFGGMSQKYCPVESMHVLKTEGYPTATQSRRMRDVGRVRDVENSSKTESSRRQGHTRTVGGTFENLFWSDSPLPQTTEGDWKTNVRTVALQIIFLKQQPQETGSVEIVEKSRGTLQRTFLKHLQFASKDAMKLGDICREEQLGARQPTRRQK